MKKAETALLVMLPLGAAWYFQHGYALISASLMAAAFAVILGAHMRGRREVRLKQEKLRHAAKSDGKYIAERLQPPVATAKGMHTTAVSGLVNFQRSKPSASPRAYLRQRSPIAGFLDVLSATHSLSVITWALIGVAIAISAAAIMYLMTSPFD